MANRGPYSVSYIQPLQKVQWQDVFQVPAGKTFKGSSGFGLNSIVAFEQNPCTFAGFAEVNDTEKLHSRKDWIVGGLEPFERTKAAQIEWKAITYALLGDQLFVRFNLTKETEFFVKGHSVQFPSETLIKQSGGGASDEIRLAVLCPERGKNGWPNWQVTSEELLKARKFDELFQSGQLMPEGPMTRATSRWPYTAAAVIYSEEPGRSQKAVGGSKRKIHILDVLLDSTKFPVLDGGEEIAESLYQALHGFLAFVARGLDNLGTEGGVSSARGLDNPGTEGRGSSAQGLDDPGTEGGVSRANQMGSSEPGKATSRIHVLLPKTFFSGSMPSEWKAQMVSAIESMGFVKGDSGWGHSLKLCSRCGAWDRKVLACSACGRVKYCSQECQKAAWKDGHKKQCKEFCAAKDLQRT